MNKGTLLTNKPHYEKILNPNQKPCQFQDAPWDNIRMSAILTFLNARMFK